jgi:hypothetical protein
MIPRPILARALVFLLLIGPVTASLYLTGAMVRHYMKERNHANNQAEHGATSDHPKSIVLRV